MSAQSEAIGKRAAVAPLNLFERYLTAWVAICMVGVLIEVPVMLLVVKVVNASKGWYETGSQA